MSTPFPPQNRQPQPRQAKGQPTGGRFAGKSNPEPDAELAGGPTVEACADGTRYWHEDGRGVSPPVGTELTVNEARALVGYTEVIVTMDVTEDREFRMLARDMPQDPDSDVGRRFTNLDTGFEVFFGPARWGNTPDAGASPSCDELQGLQAGLRNPGRFASPPPS